MVHEHVLYSDAGFLISCPGSYTLLDLKKQ